ncbi:unnamed protein product, partial [Closterium sp. NIES-54]
MAASGDLDAANADDGNPSSSNWPRTGLDFLRGHVTEAAPRPLPEPSVDSEGWKSVRKAVPQSPPRHHELESDAAEWQCPTHIEAEPVVHDNVETTEIVTEAPESSNSVALKRRCYTQTTIGFSAGTPLVKPPPPPPPTVTPASSPLKQTAAERAEAKYGFKEMVKAMCTYQQQHQMMYIHASPWIGISCDESTGRARGKHLVCDAASIFTVLLSHLETVGLDLKRIVAISTDGAGVMIGTERGLVVHLCQRIPHLVDTHCIAHREVLAVKESALKFKDLDIVDAAIRALGDIVTKSSVWHEHSKELQQEIHKTSLEHQGLFDVRWLSRGDAVQRLCRVLGAAVVVFLEYNNKMATVVQSLKLLPLLLGRFLTKINALNRFFQRRNV